MEYKKISIYHEKSHILSNASAIYEYIHGGHGVVTLQSPNGIHHTYMFTTPHGDHNFKDGTVFVYCLEGSDRCRYVGMWDTNKFRITKNSEYDEDSAQFRGARYIIWMSLKDFDTPMKLYHEGVCCRCGRSLTNPESIERGIGPVCSTLY